MSNSSPFNAKELTRGEPVSPQNGPLSNAADPSIHEIDTLALDAARDTGAHDADGRTRPNRSQEFLTPDRPTPDRPTPDRPVQGSVDIDASGFGIGVGGLVDGSLEIATPSDVSGDHVSRVERLAVADAKRAVRCEEVVVTLSAAMVSAKRECESPIVGGIESRRLHVSGRGIAADSPIAYEQATRPSWRYTTESSTRSQGCSHVPSRNGVQRHPVRRYGLPGLGTPQDDESLGSNGVTSALDPAGRSGATRDVSGAGLGAGLAVSDQLLARANAGSGGPLVRSRRASIDRVAPARGDDEERLDFAKSGEGMKSGSSTTGGQEPVDESPVVTRNKADAVGRAKRVGAAHREVQVQRSPIQQ